MRDATRVFFYACDPGCQKFMNRHSGAAAASSRRNPEPSDFRRKNKVAGFQIAASQRPE